MSSAAVEKRHKRLMVVDDEGGVVYTPPDFIRPMIRSRREMEELAQKLALTDDRIGVIVEFERCVGDRRR